MASLSFTVRITPPDAHAASMGQLKDFVESGDFSEALKKASGVMERSIGTTFDSGGRPSWTPLSPVTVARKGNSTILVESGNLRKSATRPWLIKPRNMRLRVNRSRGGFNIARAHMTGTSKMQQDPTWHSTQKILVILSVSSQSLLTVKWTNCLTNYDY